MRVALWHHVRIKMAAIVTKMTAILFLTVSKTANLVFHVPGGLINNNAENSHGTLF